ncbi:N-carbamoylputrescine amidase [Rhodovulum iodosum]|uniref:N-carbamoylputrescine amidase n=1 Tax=Rhodovulum iodosum TaxID=68291 RepID=A0ABV3XRC5_9RHOB|nr:nitrilase-related carbon-nitrogen hydrolase [Rhodovulum robiginosum]RSK32707.1 nitrilase [Rhodovulum robiginosum]
MTRPLIAAAAQFASRIGDLGANFDEHRAWVHSARAHDADLLVFPELSLAGHHGAEALLDVAIRRTDKRLLDLSREAGEMILVVGFIEEGPGAQFYNAAAVLKAGRLIYLHRKINLPSYGRLVETKYYAQGRFVDTHAIGEDWRLGLLICADLWNPALVHMAFLHGATLLVAPISSGVEAVGEGFDNPAGWAATMHFYSMMYGAPSIMANRVGTEENLTFWGGSRILDAFGQPLAVAGDGPELITAELDYGQLRQARAMLPTVRDSNLALVAREMTRLTDTLGVPDIIRHAE